MKSLNFLCLFILLGLFYPITAQPDTRDQVRIKTEEVKNSFLQDSHALEDMQRKEKDLAQMYSSETKLGFYETEDGTYEESSDIQILGALLGRQSSHSSILVLRVICKIPDSIIPIYAKLKSFTWDLDKKHTLKGEAQTDPSGSSRCKNYSQSAFRYSFFKKMYFAALNSILDINTVINK